MLIFSIFENLIFWNSWGNAGEALGKPGGWKPYQPHLPFKKIGFSDTSKPYRPRLGFIPFGKHVSSDPPKPYHPHLGFIHFLKNASDSSIAFLTFLGSADRWAAQRLISVTKKVNELVWSHMSSKSCSVNFSWEVWSWTFRKYILFHTSDASIAIIYLYLSPP